MIILWSETHKFGRILLLLCRKNFVIFCDRDQYFALAVVRGVLELRYNLGTGPAVIKTKTRVNTGKEIEVKVRVISEGNALEKARVNYIPGLTPCRT
jgi:hypothetical protein